MEKNSFLKCGANHFKCIPIVMPNYNINISSMQFKVINMIQYQYAHYPKTSLIILNITNIVDNYIQIKSSVGAKESKIKDPSIFVKLGTFLNPLHLRYLRFNGRVIQQTADIHCSK